MLNETPLTSKFEKQVSKIDSRKLKQDILGIILQAEKAGSIAELKSLKKLVGYKYHFRIRLDDYRIGLYLDNDVLEFAAFDNRKDIYKYFP